MKYYGSYKNHNSNSIVTFINNIHKMHSLKLRLTTGWTFQRAIFAIIGTIIVVQSIADNQWVFALFGLYFASMGLFAYGCASGNCYTITKKESTTE